MSGAVGLSVPSQGPAAEIDGEMTSGLADFISFAIGEDQYGIDIMPVREVQPVPRTVQSGAEFLAGLVTHEDTMVALIDLRSLLALRDDESTAEILAA